MTFYKSVEQKDANPELTPAADAKTDTAAALGYACRTRCGGNDELRMQPARPDS